MYFWFVIETYDNLLSSCCCYMAALYFETHFLEFKNVLDLWFELVHDVFVLIDVLACILTRGGKNIFLSANRIIEPEIFCQYSTIFRRI